MRSRYFGLDLLRGLGVFVVIALHSVFYRFGASTTWICPTRPSW
ncbi:MAG: hypothetical protein NT080_01885 [Spirochaetes bacterium]|nr:hypothetical protein [Spirochaetota bacterium]